jgi:GDPmannose 4,6-dehydratase
MENKIAVVTGVSGQTASYLCELLLDKGYRVIGTRRRTSTPNNDNLINCLSHPNFELVIADITDYSCIHSLLMQYKPDEIYNLAAQSFVKASFDQPFHTFETDTIGVLNFLEVIRKEKLETKFYQASTSEMFGKSYSQRTITNPKYVGRTDVCDFRDIYNPIAPDDYLIIEKYQDENTIFMPQSPYGIAKLAAHHLCRLYRQSYGIHACCGILFNHESPRRGKEFVTRKITDYVGKLRSMMDKAEYQGDADIVNNAPKLKLGNLDAYRDWGHAKDYARAQYLIMQQDKPEDFVICMEETHTVREFCDAAFKTIGLDYNDWVEIDPQFYRPSEVDFLLGDCTKAKSVLNWKPEYTFEQLVEEMVQADIERHKNG